MCSVYAYCPNCFDVHPLNFDVFVPTAELKIMVTIKGINDVYKGYELPDNYVFTNNDFVCPVNKKTYYQKDNTQIFFVPVSETQS
jgi:hypothetical protein